VNKNWKIKPQGCKSAIEQLVIDLGVNKTIANLLTQRNVTSFEDAKSFFRPDLTLLHDPFLMKDMDTAVDRISHCIEHNKKILIYGDYDVDGTTSVAMVYSFLKKITRNILYYIPNRDSEGYGISFKGINYAIENKIDLIISLDCGIKSIDKVSYAKENNIDFIICDHHYPGDNIPDAIAVLDPKRRDCSYPYKELSGCGVGYKLLQAYCIREQISLSFVEIFLDLVAVSIASDIVPITGENRILAYFGLIQLNKCPCTGLKSIINISGLENKDITIDDIVYKIGPRINAAGRIENGIKAVELLVSDNGDEALSLVGKIDNYNNTRKNIDGIITSEALKLIGENPKLKDNNSTVLFNPNWHKGVIGIVASRLIEYYYRPTIILTESNGMATGSARSVEGFDLYQAINACSELLENFGGHMFAAGLTLKIENVPAFKEKFEEVVASTIKSDQLAPTIEIDTELDLKDINSKFFRILRQFQPFGPGNLSPVFLTKNVADNGNAKIVGSNSDHLKLEIIHESDPFHTYPAIAFQMSEHFNYIKNGNPFDICYSIEENAYRGNTSLQLRLRDIK
jgi:single-stranded-DNA-specific exonuclease